MIVQMFDQPFARVLAELPRLRRLGFSHVLVSPPQKSHPSRRWWARYQPVDYRSIEGPLGGADDLHRLCQEAARRGMAVVADAVLNHMSNHPAYVRMRGSRVLEARFPQFGAQDFHGGGGRAAARPRLGRGARLPELRTDTPWVRDRLRDYLRLLHRLGVRGFRFDAAKHLDPGLVPYALQGLGDLLCFGEMIYAHAEHFPAESLAVMRAYDFPLARAMKQAFAPGGDLRRLVFPESRGEALWGPAAIPFVNSHDLVKRRRDLGFFRIDDAHDRRLAHLYLLGRQDGTPLVYGGDLRHREVREGVGFHGRALGQPMNWLHAERDVLVFARGDSMLVGINKSGHPWVAGALATGLRPGTYRDRLGPAQHVDGRGLWRPAFVPARGAVLLER